MTIVADPKRLGARAGTTSVLHAWGSALTHHSHILAFIGETLWKILITNNDVSRRTFYFYDEE